MNRQPDKNLREIRPIIIRKSIALLAIRIILLELLFEIIYLTWRSLIHFIPVSIETMVTLNMVSLIIFIVLVTIIQNVILIYIILSWSNYYYEFQENEIAHYSGILTKTKKSYRYQDIQSVTVKKSILGRLFNYGSITLFIPTQIKDIHFNEVSDPKSFAKLFKSSKSSIQGSRYILDGRA